MERGRVDGGDNIDWEAILAEDGMPEVLAHDAVPSGDALEINDRPAARLRQRDAAREESTDRMFDPVEEPETEE